MHISTYKQVATDGEVHTKYILFKNDLKYFQINLPNSTTKDQQEQPFLERPLYVEQEYPRKMIDRANINVANAALDGYEN